MFSCPETMDNIQETPNLRVVLPPARESRVRNIMAPSGPDADLTPEQWRDQQISAWLDEIYEERIARQEIPPPRADLSVPPLRADLSAPPPYDVATNSKLPTYEEVQREKMMEGELPGQPQIPTQNSYSTLLTIETTELNSNLHLLGTDMMFFTSFILAFLFNWIGFLLLMCFCHTVASRYGALAGFGLSLTKWTLIVKHSTALASHENSWLWWLIMGFGISICIRGIIQYQNIKRGWRLLSETAQEQLLFFH